MMVKSRGPVWHKKQKDQNIIPKGLTGVDRQATWGKSAYDGWIYGHGTFCLVSHKIPMIGAFRWMPNSGNEAKKMEVEVEKYAGIIKRVFMDSKADDQKIYFNLKKNFQIQLVTKTRRNMDKSESRKRMIREIMTPMNICDYKERSITVEPMQGLTKNIFELDNCWMRGNDSNRWIFAAMGIAMQMSQWKAYLNNQSTFEIKSDVLGI